MKVADLTVQEMALIMSNIPLLTWVTASIFFLSHLRNSMEALICASSSTLVHNVDAFVDWPPPLFPSFFLLIALWEGEIQITVPVLVYKTKSPMLCYNILSIKPWKESNIYKWNCRVFFPKLMVTARKVYICSHLKSKQGSVLMYLWSGPDAAVYISSGKWLTWMHKCCLSWAENSSSFWQWSVEIFDLCSVSKCGRVKCRFHLCVNTVIERWLLQVSHR